MQMIDYLSPELKTAAQVAGVFAAMFVTDVCWTRWSLNVSAHRATPAAFYGVGIVAGSATVTLGYVDNHWMLIPAIIASFVSTWLVVHRESKKVAA
jgi:hypothetical protein